MAIAYVIHVEDSSSEEISFSLIYVSLIEDQELLLHRWPGH